IWRVEALRWFADELERLRILQRRILRRREARCFLDQFAVTQLPSVAVNDLTVLRAARVGANVPCLRGRSEQHLARRSAGFAHALPFRPRARAAAGHLDAIDRMI